MELIYQNFDGLDVSFMGALPSYVLDQLAAAKEEAQVRRGDAYVELGLHKLPVAVGESGSRGGYRYRFDTGPDGETWFIAHNNKVDRWNIRVSVHSLALALHGYEGVKGRLLATLIKLDAQGSLQVSVARFDYCFDFLTTKTLILDAAFFVAHKNCKKTREGEKEVVPYMDAATGDTVETLRVGKMPGRQATIYNKSQEIKVRNKSYWKNLWNIGDREGVVWRVEVRSGKDDLKKWDITTFEQFEAKAGDVILDILKSIRYTAPTADSNRARWPSAPFWQTCLDRAGEALAPYISYANRETILSDLRLNVTNGYKTRLQGNVIGLVAALGRDIGEVDEVMEEFRQEFLQNLSENKEKFFEKFQTAEKRFLHLTG